MFNGRMSLQAIHAAGAGTLSDHIGEREVGITHLDREQKDVQI